MSLNLFYKNVNKRLAEHMTDLKEVGRVPLSWFWKKYTIRRLNEIDINLIQDLDKLHKTHLDNPTIYDKLTPILQTLHKDLEIMLNQSNIDGNVQEKEAEIVNNLLISITQLFPKFDYNLKLSKLRNWIIPSKEELKHLNYSIQEYEDLIPFLIERFDDIEKRKTGLDAIFFKIELPSLNKSKILNSRNWPYILQLIDNSPVIYGMKNFTITSTLIDLQKLGKLNISNWPTIVKLNEINYFFLHSGNTIISLQEKGMLTSSTWPYLLQIIELDNRYADKIIIILEKLNMFIPNKLQFIIKNLKKLLDSVKTGRDELFDELFPILIETKLLTSENLEIIINKIIFITPFIKGIEKVIFKQSRYLYYYFILFGITAFDEFIIPIVKSQKVGSSSIFESCGKIFDLNAVKDKNDVTLLLFIITRYLTKANVILKDVIIEGLEKGYISKPISKDGEIIKIFLENAPGYIIDIYPAFKEIYLSNASDKNMKIGLLFKDIKNLKAEIYEGKLSKIYDEHIFMSVLYHVFACHDMTVPKERYVKSYSQRSDRENDIPSKFRKPITIRLTKGGYKLKNENDPVSSDAWDLIIRSAREIKHKREYDLAAFGFELLTAYENKNIESKKEYFIHGIYQFSFNHGEGLPDFQNSYEVLVKYIEFVGDRIVNDLIYGIIKESLENDPELFFKKQNNILEKKVDFSGLAKQIEGILTSNQPEDKKTDIISKVLSQNGFHVENIDEIKLMNVKQIKDLLSNKTPNIVEKGLVAKIFNALYGQEYEKMKTEMVKYEFNKESRMFGGEKYTFLLSKKKEHCVATYNMGVCVARDDKLWNSSDFWQLIIFDEDHNAHGGTILRTIEEYGKKYLILSIQPSQSILNKVAPPQLFDKIISYSKIIAKKLNYQNVLIPINEAIHSNRRSIQSVIKERYIKTTPLKLKKEYEFSYSPHNYKYQEFYIVY